MKDWIPLLQSLTWPVLIVGLAIWLRSALKKILLAISDRIRSGAPFEAGPGGIKLGAVQGPPSTAKSIAASREARSFEGLPHPVYMTHQAIRDPIIKVSGQQYYRLIIALDADEPGLLDEVEKVIYHLHPTFRDPDRTSEDRKTDFAIGTAAWGEFNMTAEIFFRQEKPKLVVERYINFPAA